MAPVVALTARITGAEGYVEPRDSISHDWIRLLDGMGLQPVVLPNALADHRGYFDAVAPRLLLMTGGDDPGATPLRDTAELTLFDHALAAGIPVLGICRGLQLTNTYLGGRIAPIEGHVAADHAVRIGAPFDTLYGPSTSVNSYHSLSVPSDGLAPGLVAWAWDEAGWVEGAVDFMRPFIGIMWHPERAGSPEGDRQLLRRLVDDGGFWL